jgi:hypothetical protein
LHLLFNQKQTLLAMALFFKTRIQVADEYNITTKTLVARLANIGIILPDGSLSPKTQKQIYDALGYPSSVDRSDYDDV